MSAATSTSSSAVTPVGSKASMFVAKSGFVIPKNKLSGSLVPVSRGGKRAGGQGVTSEDNVNQVQRKTRWGLDLTLDTAVRKGRALAFETRVDQITEQLQSGIVDLDKNQGVDDQRLELLELERREAIGEILKLSPSYKAPPDYEPLLKEARVPVSMKEHTGRNFIGLIFGPDNETQKRLEKETGAKIRVYGAKAGAEEEVEVMPTDAISSDEVVYKELSVCITADTFDKVDAAVSVIELLLTSLTDNPTKGDHTGAQNLDISTSPLAPAAVDNEGQQVAHQGQFQYQGPWISPMTAYASQNTSFISPQNHSAPISSSTLPLLTGNHQASAPSFPATHQQPLQPPRNFFDPAAAASAENMPYGQHVPAGFASNVRLSVPALQHTPPSVRPGMSSNQPFIPTGSSSGWPAFTPAIPRPLHPANPGPMVSQMGTSQGPLPVVPPIGFSSFKAPSNASGANIVSSVSLPSGPSTVSLPSTPMTHTAGAPGFASGPSYPMGPSSRTLPVQSPSAGAVALPSLNPSINPGSAANVAPIRPPVVGDFTFKVHPSPDPNFQRFPRMNIQPATQSSLPPSPQVPSFRLTMPNTTTQPGMHMFSRPQVGNQINQIPAHIPNAHFAGNPAGTLFPPRFPAFPSSGAPAVPQAQLSNLSSIQAPNLAGPFPPRPRNSLQLQHGSPMPTNSGGNLVRPTERFTKNSVTISGITAPGPRRPQIYDPFSPTSVSSEPQHGSNQGKNGNRENDTEYEDLMASVGVK